MAAVLDALVAIVLVGVLVTVAVIDARRRIIPNAIVLPAAAVVLVARTVAHPSPVWILAGLGAGLFLLLPAVLRPGSMGMGDVKLAFLIGCAVGREVPLALAVGLVAAALPSLGLLVRHGLRARTMTLPLGPFLALGGVVGLALAGL